MSKCPICKRAKCKWIELASDPKTLSTEKLEEVVNHNLSVIEMTFAGNNNGSAHAEERMYERLNPYCEEIEARK